MTREERLAVEESVQEIKREEADSRQRVKEAAAEILEVSRRLHLTWREFDRALESVKYYGHIT